MSAETAAARPYKDTTLLNDIYHRPFTETPTNVDTLASTPTTKYTDSYRSPNKSTQEHEYISIDMSKSKVVDDHVSVNADVLQSEALINQSSTEAKHSRADSSEQTVEDVLDTSKRPTMTQREIDSDPSYTSAEQYSENHADNQRGVLVDVQANDMEDCGRGHLQRENITLSKKKSSHTTAKTTEKHGHRRVLQDGTQVYKKAESNVIMDGIQFGLGVAIGSITPKEQKDILMKDFKELSTIWCPKAGTQLTPAHNTADFTFFTYAPKAFRYFREAFGIKPEDFLLSLCTLPLKELSNPGASGSLFYLSPDDNFIIKTVSNSESKFLRKMLPGYFLNLTQNTKTLLPKFFGLYCYRTALGKNIRFVIMNNVLPTNLTLNEKFDLKGSTYKRKASKEEEMKNSPTLKDLNILACYDGGIWVEQRAFDAIARTLRRDCRVLQSFGIMDYSILLGVHHLTASSFLALSEKHSSHAGTVYSFASVMSVLNLSDHDYAGKQPTSDTFNGGVLGFINSDQPVLLFLGVIDVLQTYKLRKRMEHTLKAAYADGETISVCEPKFYASRLQSFMLGTVFKPVCADVAASLMTAAHRKWNVNKSIPSVIERGQDVQQPISVPKSHVDPNENAKHRRIYEHTKRPEHLQAAAIVS
eukprot:CFRG0146T1